MELQHAILGLLAIRPMSGYDLGRAFRATVDHFWHADPSQIYRTLHRLADAEMISTTVIPHDSKPDRKEHALTSVGRAELDRWLASPIEADQPKEPFLARVFFAGELGFDGARALLAERERQVEAHLERLVAIPTTDDDLAGMLRSATLRSGIAGARAELDWVRETSARVSALEAAS